MKRQGGTDWETLLQNTYLKRQNSAETLKSSLAVSYEQMHIVAPKIHS